MNKQSNPQSLFPDEDMKVMPFMLEFGEEAEGTENRDAGCESEYWTAQYNCPDSD